MPLKVAQLATSQDFLNFSVKIHLVKVVKRQENVSSYYNINLRKRSY
jgi:hypothetical protein